jgi:hypothetical protein
MAPHIETLAKKLALQRGEDPDNAPKPDPFDMPYMEVTPERDASGASMRRMKTQEALDNNGKHKENSEHMRLFEIWYACNRNSNRAAKQAGYGHVTIRRYREWFDWERRADERDKAFQTVADKAAIHRQTEMLDKHFTAGNSLIDRGLEYLQKYEIDNARDAINAIRVGIEVQRRNQGLPDWIAQIASSGDDELVQRARELVKEISEARAALSSAGDADDGMGIDDINSPELGYDPDPEDVRDRVIEAEIISSTPRKGTPLPQVGPAFPAFPSSLPAVVDPPPPAKPPARPPSPSQPSPALIQGSFLGGTDNGDSPKNRGWAQSASRSALDIEPAGRADWAGASEDSGAGAGSESSDEANEADGADENFFGEEALS